MRRCLTDRVLAALALLGLLSCTKYDAYRPDTRANRRMFARHVGFAVPSGVTDLYCYADELGADVSYQLGFTTDSATVQRIVSAQALTQRDPEFGIGIGRELPWWKPDDLRALVPYWKQNPDGDYFWFLWYNPATKRAWFLEYST
jgi:hypothetical protein